MLNYEFKNKKKVDCIFFRIFSLRGNNDSLQLGTVWN